MLEGRGAVLATARHISQILIEHDIAGAVIVGVSVTLHGHVRATSDVDVFVPEPLTTFAEYLQSAGYTFNAKRREFALNEVPVHLVLPAQANPTPTHFISIDDVRTVSLADLINLKLHSGTSNLLRAQDIADVIALIQANKLDGRFTSRISKPLRPEFRKLLAAIRTDKERRKSDGGDPYSHPG